MGEASAFGIERAEWRTIFILAVYLYVMPVVLPALLLAWEWIYAGNDRRRSSNILSPFLRLLPFFPVALAAAIGRTRSNPFESPLFVYHFDGIILANLADYVGRLTYGAFTPAMWHLLVLLGVTLAAAVLLCSRHMLFGWI